jgi:hypothetical protein
MVDIFIMRANAWSFCFVPASFRGKPAQTGRVSLHVIDQQENDQGC